MIRTFCDRCGQEIDKIDNRAIFNYPDRIYVRGPYADVTSTTFTLCELCYDRVKKFLEG